MFAAPEDAVFFNSLSSLSDINRLPRTDFDIINEYCLRELVIFMYCKRVLTWP